MKELVEVIAKSLVDHPDEVVVTERETDKSIIVELKVASEDMGKVIGKQGRIAKSIRTVVKAAQLRMTKSSSGNYAIILYGGCCKRYNSLIYYILNGRIYYNYYKRKKSNG